MCDARRLYKSLPGGEAVKTIVGQGVPWGPSLALERTEKEIVMKMRIITVAFAAVLATPALAQTVHSQARPYDPPTYARDQNGNPSDDQSRARVRPSPNSHNDVYNVRGRYIGSDPDPVVRGQLRQDPTQGVD